MNEQNTQKYILRPVVVGVTGAAIVAVVFGHQGSMPLLGMSVSIPLAAGVVIGSSAALSAYLEGEVTAALPGVAGQLGAGLLRPAVAGVSTLGMATLAFGMPADASSAAILTALGAGSVVAGDYVGTMVGA